MLLAATFLVLLAAICLAWLGVVQLERGAKASRLVVERVTAGGVDEGRTSLVESLDRRLARHPRGRRLAEQLAAGGSRLSPGRFLLIGLVGVPGTWVVTSLVLPRVLALASAVSFGFGMRAWLRHKQAQRREQFIAQLPDLARLLSNATGAGLALRSAIDLSAREMPEPAASELRFVVESVDVGIPIDDALDLLASRLPSRELSVLVTTLVVQHRAGGQLITALRNISETLDARKSLRREVRTLMSGAVATSYIVAAMGVGTLLLLNLLNPDVLDEMTGNPIGQLALLVAGALYLLGFTIIRRITRIEV